MATVEKAKMKRLGVAVRGGVIAVEIGSERVKYYIHKALLEKHSEYFKRALNGSWKEAGEKNVCLDDVECSTFEVFVDWLCPRDLPVGEIGWIEGDYNRGKKDQWPATLQIEMIKACAFADRMLSPNLRCALERELIDHFGFNPYYQAIIYAFETLPPKSPVLRVLVDAHGHGFHEAIDNEKNGELDLCTQLPSVFLVGVMLRQAKLMSKEQPNLNRCDYHEHASEDEKQECQNSEYIFDFD